MPDYRSLMKKIEMGAPPDRRYYWSRYKLFPNETMAPCDMRRMDGWAPVDPKEERFSSRFGKDLKGDKFTPGQIRLDASDRVVIGDLVLMETTLENAKRRRDENHARANDPMKRLADGGHIPPQHLSIERPVVFETKPDDAPTRSHTPVVAPK